MRRAVITGLAAVAVLLAAVASAAPTGGAPRSNAPAARAAASVTVAAAGDIACAPGFTVTSRTCQHRATANLIADIGVAAVLPLGDLQYEVGALAAFRRSYDSAWGRFNAKAYPVPGNHEYQTPGASGYYAYFGARAHGAPGYYAYNLGRWRAYALNSNCSVINCAAETTWLRNDLAANPRSCVLAYMHHPRFSSGEHGNTTAVTQFWTALSKRRADVVLAGHDHGYERFARKNPSGGLTSAGIRSFVVGTGGKSLYPFGSRVTGSQVRLNGSAGVLFLDLREGSYRWVFRTIDGTVRDSGTSSCI